MTKTEASKERLKEEQAGAARRRALLQYSLREEGGCESHGTRARTLPLGPCPCPRGFRNHSFLVRTREESYFPSDFLNNGVQLSGTQLSTLKAAEE